MRIILVTGKGGVGKTTVSAATALRSADLGYRTLVMSTDPAHSLGDAFDTDLGDTPTQVVENLDAQQIDSQQRLEESWGEVRDHLTELFDWSGVSGIEAEELTVFPGMDEGLFFFGAFAYVYYLRDKGLLPGLADGTNWVFRDESCHMNFAFEAIRVVQEETPELFTTEMQDDIREMLREAVECEYQFAADVLGDGVPGMSLASMREYLQSVADTRLVSLGLVAEFGSKNPFPFMELQDVQSLSNFFERTVSAYQMVGGSEADVVFDADF